MLGKEDDSNGKLSDAAPSLISMKTIRKNPKVDKKITNKQANLEQQLYKQSSYKLTKDDIKNVLLEENIIKYKRFELSAY